MLPAVLVDCFHGYVGMIVCVYDYDLELKKVIEVGPIDLYAMTKGSYLNMRLVRVIIFLPM